MKKNGFSLTEVIVTTAMIGTLTSISIPKYVNQLIRTRQSECVSVLSKVITATMGYYDEYGDPPQSWKDLNSMSAIMQGNGTSGDDDHFDPIKLSSGNYGISASIDGEIYNFECIPEETRLSNYNAMGCLNTSNGASEIKRGTKEAIANTANCN